MSTSPVTRGLWLGLVGILTFSLTLPATRVAVTTLSPFFVGMGRVELATVAAVLYLWLSKQRWPTKAEWRDLAMVAVGVVVGFPILTAVAMQQVNASHGAVVLGVLPMCTAVAGVLLSHERPSRAFWVVAVIGAVLVTAFTGMRSSGEWSLADAALLLAVACAALGYAAGARLVQALGGLQVISWALVLAAPVLLIPTIYFAPRTLDQPLPVWISFLYVSFISQFLGFWPWYKGLALGGIVRVSQVQLLQPFFTLLAAALLLGEPFELSTLLFALLVVAVVALGRKLR